MHILFINRASIPVFAYGGTERVIWDLGQALVKMGHRVLNLIAHGKAAWSVKNVQGAIDSSLQANAPLIVMGGDRLNIKLFATPYASKLPWQKN
eukprot:gene45085-56126_t